MQTGWLKDIDGNWYYLTSDGSMATGWVHDGNTWYYTNSSGVMQTGWIMVDSKWYYLNTSGAMVTGWRQVGASWYYFKPNGVMVTDWNLIGGKWYYMHGTGFDGIQSMDRDKRQMVLRNKRRIDGSQHYYRWLQSRRKRRLG